MPSLTRPLSRSAISSSLPEEEAAVLRILLNAERLDLATDYKPTKGTPTALTPLGELYLPLEGLIDFEQERERLRREQDKLKAEASRLDAQLANPQFVERAPAEKVNDLRARLADIAQRTAALAQTLEALQ